MTLISAIGLVLVLWILIRHLRRDQRDKARWKRYAYDSVYFAYCLILSVFSIYGLIEESDIAQQIVYGIAISAGAIMMLALVIKRLRPSSPRIA